MCSLNVASGQPEHLCFDDSPDSGMHSNKKHINTYKPITHPNVLTGSHCAVKYMWVIKTFSSIFLHLTDYDTEIWHYKEVLDTEWTVNIVSVSVAVQSSSCLLDRMSCAPGHTAAEQSFSRIQWESVHEPVTWHSLTVKDTLHDCIVGSRL